ncbi:hypothetical protein LEN26_007515 [Aphanomyces euteiches]|nr:hypothetical protein LEN26_007515 [Aphanomyces euteiches]
MAGCDGFPQCQPPKGAQEIAGMAMVETTVRDEYPNGAFMLTVFADKTMSDSILHTNSDGTTDMLIANINQTLIATNGSMTVDSLGVNGVHYSVPIGTRYKISIQSYPVVLDITRRIDPNTWWNVGRMSKKAVTMTWDYGHTVNSRTELVVLELGFLFTGGIFISGDFYLTYQGLKGFLARKPVMTYDLAAGLERRKISMFCWTCSHVMSLVYPDVVRVITGPTTFLWFMATLLVCSFYICSVLILLAWLSYVPSPFKRVMTISFNAMIHITFVVFVIVYMCVLPWILDNYRQSPQALSLNISGVLRPSGAYANDGQLGSAVNLLFPVSMIVVAICMIMSVSFSTYYLKRDHNMLFLSLEWTRTNGFLSHCTMPNWITGLPLDEFKVIKIGNKLFCKPSTQATLGFATVVSSETTKLNIVIPMTSHEEETLTIVSVYSLLPCLASLHRWLPRPLHIKTFGTSMNNEFIAAPQGNLDSEHYSHHCGTCLN